MNPNKALWSRVCVTDPKAVKPITGKQYAGNSPKPYWIVERLTDEFGPCGIGWGFSIVSERMERLAEGEILHVAVVCLWYTLDGKRGELEQIGQTRAVYKKKSGDLMIDEDAPKKSVTDALVKCASYLGFAGDIFSGRWDDSRYVAEANREWRDREAAEREPEPPKPGVIAPAKEAAARTPITDAQRKEVETLGADMVEAFDAGNEAAALKLWRGVEDADVKVHLWAYLGSESKLRAFLKAQGTQKAAA